MMNDNFLFFYLQQHRAPDRRQQRNHQKDVFARLKVQKMPNPQQVHRELKKVFKLLMDNLADRESFVVFDVPLDSDSNYSGFVEVIADR